MRREIKELVGAAALLALAYLPVALAQPHCRASIGVFLGLHLALILIPAACLGRAFLPDTPLLPALFVGIVPATSLLIICGIIQFRFHVPHFALLAPVLAVSTLAWFRRGPPRELASIPLLAICAILVGVVVLLQTVALTVPASLPSQGVPGLFYQDSLWTVGNTVSLERWGLPLRDIRFEGLHLSYHLAQNVYQAVMSTYGGLEPFDIHFYLEPTIGRASLAVLCVFLPRIFFGASTKSSVLLAVLVLFTCGWTGPGHFDLYANPLSYAFGLPAFLVFHGVLFRRETLRVRGAPLLAALAFALALASKGNLLLLVPAGLAPWLLRPMLRWQWPRRELIWIAVGVAIAGGLILLTLFRAPPEGSERVVVFPLNHNSIVYRLLVDRLHLGLVGLVLFAGYQFAFFFIVALRFVLGGPAPVAILLLLLVRQNRKVLLSTPMWSYVAAFTSAALAAISIADFIGGYTYFLLYPQVLCALWLAARFDELAPSRLRAVIVGVPLAMAIYMFGATGLAWHRGWSQFPTPERTVWDPQVTYDA
ncbi:MAG TPA: hypothetical protein VIV40_00495, partial [Kofleriaceae bacterium]